MLIPDWLAHRASVSPETAAVIAGDTRCSFADLDHRAAAAAGKLAALGVRRGDRAALLARNSLSFVEIVHGLMRLGAVLVPLNTRLAADELLWQLRDVGATLLIHDAHTAFPADTLRRMWPDLQTCPLPLEGAVSEGEQPAFSRRVDLSALQCIIYTAGTTGRPKGALLTYGNHWWSAVGSALNLGIQPDDRWLAVLPLFHVGGLAILMRSVIYGIPAVLHESFDPAAVNRAIDEDGVTIVSVVAAMLQRLLEERGERPYPSTLRCVLLGGGPAPRRLLQDCARLKVPVVSTYGLTEAASQVTALSPTDAARKLGSSGKPLLPTELRIQQSADTGSPRPGEIGEIVVRGPTVSPGYVNIPAARGDDHWLHMGDLGYLDEDGFLYVVDRRDDLIVSGGENVYPSEVESVLSEHPAVEEAGVTGRPDREWGQVPVAAVKLRAGETAEAEELLAFCRGRLAGYKVPARLWFVDALPRNAGGKLLRRELRQQ